MQAIIIVSRVDECNCANVYVEMLVTIAATDTVIPVKSIVA